MAPKFKARRRGQISVQLDDAERTFLSELVVMLRAVASQEDDPGHARLNVPPYLGDNEASSEWRRLMGDQLEDGRTRDRDLMTRVLDDEPPIEIGHDEALSLLRVINEARLVLAARLGVEVPDDYESLDVGSTIALHFLGLLLEDLTDELGASLG